MHRTLKDKLKLFARKTPRYNRTHLDNPQDSIIHVYPEQNGDSINSESFVKGGIDPSRSLFDGMSAFPSKDFKIRDDKDIRTTKAKSIVDLAGTIGPDKISHFIKRSGDDMGKQIDYDLLQEGNAVPANPGVRPGLDWQTKRHDTSSEVKSKYGNYYDPNTTSSQQLTAIDSGINYYKEGDKLAGMHNLKTFEVQMPNIARHPEEHAGTDASEVKTGEKLDDKYGVGYKGDAAIGTLYDSNVYGKKTVISPSGEEIKINGKYAKKQLIDSLKKTFNSDKDRLVKAGKHNWKDIYNIKDVAAIEGTKSPLLNLKPNQKLFSTLRAISSALFTSRLFSFKEEIRSFSRKKMHSTGYNTNLVGKDNDTLTHRSPFPLYKDEGTIGTPEGRNGNLDSMAKFGIDPKSGSTGRGLSSFKTAHDKIAKTGDVALIRKYLRDKSAKLASRDLGHLENEVGDFVPDPNKRDIENKVDKIAYDKKITDYRLNQTGRGIPIIIDQDSKGINKQSGGFGFGKNTYNPDSSSPQQFTSMDQVMANPKSDRGDFLHSPKPMFKIEYTDDEVAHNPERYAGTDASELLGQNKAILGKDALAALDWDNDYYGKKNIVVNGGEVKMNGKWEREQAKERFRKLYNDHREHFKRQGINNYKGLINAKDLSVFEGKNFQMPKSTLKSF